MLHAVGAEHEMSRQDRDNYITVVMDNLEGGWDNGNYIKAETSDIYPFDPASDLMYGIYVSLI